MSNTQQRGAGKGKTAAYTTPLPFPFIFLHYSYQTDHSALASGTTPAPGLVPKKPGFASHNKPKPKPGFRRPATTRPTNTTNTTRSTVTNTSRTSTSTSPPTTTTTKPKPTKYKSPFVRTHNPLPSNANKARIVEKFDKPRLPVDMEEFRREVAEHGLKTLKDSRWAT
ncbi:hypothetical protein HD806DRAFT_549426 [Xylariaceae sp. AK1471]|nr:hypothetical protein HD806DRAFT_549426 [Xylariaceae sp. AK1471]